MICLLHLGWFKGVFCFQRSSLNPSWKIIGSWIRLPALGAHGVRPSISFVCWMPQPWALWSFNRWMGGVCWVLKLSDWGRTQEGPKNRAEARNGKIFSVLDVWFLDWWYSYLICNYMSGWGGKWGPWAIVKECRLDWCRNLQLCKPCTCTLHKKTSVELD